MLEISEVAARSGLPASALRYYEEQGLIRSAGRSGIRRIYENDILPRLQLILLGQAAGFSLQEIGLLIGQGDQMALDRQMLGQKADELDQKIRELRALRDGLRHVMGCTAPNHLQCPNFQRILQLGVKRQRKKRGKVLKSA